MVDHVFFLCTVFQNPDRTGVVELEGPEELASCDLSNPIRMYTDEESHVALEKEGARYFASGNVDSCKNGHRMSVFVHPPPHLPLEESDIPSPHHRVDPDPEPHHRVDPEPYPAAATTTASVIVADVLLVAAMVYLMAN